MLEVPWLAVELREWFAVTRWTFPWHLSSPSYRYSCKDERWMQECVEVKPDPSPFICFKAKGKMSRISSISSHFRSNLQKKPERDQEQRNARSPGGHQRLDLFIKLLSVLCPNLTDSSLNFSNTGLMVWKWS